MRLLIRCLSILTSIFTLVPIAPAHAQTPAANEAALDEALDVQIETLVKIYGPHVFSLDRDLITFHYENAHPTWEPETLSDVKGHVLGWPERFFDNTVSSTDMEGPGTYVSDDPFATRSYGGMQNPQLYVLTIKKGARLVNTIPSFEPEEKRALQKMLDTLACKTDGQSLNSLSNAIGLFRNSPTPNCRALITRAFERLNIQGILYNYTSSDTLSGCRMRSEAINIISSRVIKADELGFYSDKRKVEGKPMAGYLAKLYAEASQDFSIQLGTSTLFSAPPLTLAKPSALEPFYRRWKARRILKCGAPWAFERVQSDVDIDYISGKMKRSLADKEIHLLIIKFKSAFEQKALGKAFFYPGKLAQLRAIEELGYRASGFASDDSKFVQWQKAIDGLIKNGPFNDQRIREIAALLEESAPAFSEDTAVEVMKKALVGVPRLATPQPGLYGYVFEKVGFGPRLSRLQNNYFAMAQGGVPFLTEEYSTNPTSPDRELFAKNKAVFKATLEKCIAVYGDSTLSFEEIQAGACGIRESKN